ncbi:MAG: DUF167 domain-containing protein [Aquificota bacterium]|nr:DUF167 domain-containing protein [Aquificota bacterium]
MLLRVRVSPLSKEESVKEVGDGELFVRVSSPPLQGRANRRVVELIAKHFGVPPSRVRIVKGYRSRNKILEVDL